MKNNILIYSFVLIVALFSCTNNTESVQNENCEQAHDYVDQLMERSTVLIDEQGDLDSVLLLLDYAAEIIDSCQLYGNYLYPDLLNFYAVYWYYAYKDYTKSIEYLKKAADELAKSDEKDFESLGVIHNNIAFMLQENDQFILARHHLSIALHYYKQDSVENAGYINQAYLNISSNFNYQHQYDSALYYIYKCLNQTTEMHGENSTEVAKAFGQLARILRNMGDYELSLSYREKQIELFEKNQSDVHLGRVYNNTGVLLTSMGRYVDAIEFLEKALSSYQNVYTANSPRIAGVLINIGTAYQGMGDLKKALDYHQRGLEIELAHFETEHLSVAITFGVLGKTYKMMNLHKQAMEHFMESLKIRKALTGKYTTEASDDYRNMAEVLFEKGDIEHAYLYLDTFTMIKDSIVRLTEIRTTHELKALHETEYKELQNELLRAENELKDEQVSQQQQLMYMGVGGFVLLLSIITLLLNYRAKRIKEKAEKQLVDANFKALKSLMDKHFIFGSLNSIDAFIYKNEPEKASEFLVQFAGLIRNILDKSEQHETSLKEELDLCKSYLELERIRHRNAFAFEIKIEDSLNTEKIMFPSLMLQPLVENAVKHGIGSLINESASPDEVKGIVSIHVKKVGKQLIVSVSDNGKGLSNQNKETGHQSYAQRGIRERIENYNRIRQGKAAYRLNETDTGVTTSLVYEA